MLFLVYFILFQVAGLFAQVGLYLPRCLHFNLSALVLILQVELFQVGLL